jgi:pimeloyl-ACP methyl ester carboxylesterase
MLPIIARFAPLRRIAFRDLITDGSRVPRSDALAMFQGARGCEVVEDVLNLAGTSEAFGELGPIGCPIRILYGTNDRLLRWPGHFTRLRRMLPDADWVPLEGMGHLPMWDSPEAVAMAILEHTQASLGRAGTTGSARAGA